MEREETLREIAALRHNLHINNRLRLEFLASISKLLRDYGITANDDLLSSLILAVPGELSAKYNEPIPPIEPPTAPELPEEPVAPIEPPIAPELPEEPMIPPIEPPVAPK